MKDTNLRPLPDRSADSFATFLKVSSGNKDHGVSNASFIDGHVQKVNAWGHEARETWELAWPGEEPAPIF
jgi:prepilin-type processing-associated H-X9-DG protein